MAGGRKRGRVKQPQASSRKAKKKDRGFSSDPFLFPEAWSLR